MLRKLTVDQINDWFTIGKTVSDVELLGLPPTFLAEPTRDEAPLRDAALGAVPATSESIRAPEPAQAEARPAAASAR